MAESRVALVALIIAVAALIGVVVLWFALYGTWLILEGSEPTGTITTTTTTTLSPEELAQVEEWIATWKAKRIARKKRLIEFYRRLLRISANLFRLKEEEGNGK